MESGVEGGLLKAEGSRGARLGKEKKAASRLGWGRRVGGEVGAKRFKTGEGEEGKASAKGKSVSGPQNWAIPYCFA